MNVEQTMFRSTEDGRWFRILFIDPGITGSGCAFWKELVRKADGKASPPDITEVLSPPTKDSWPSRVRMLSAWMHGLVHSLLPTHIVIEFPELWSGSAISQASASTGSLFKLTYLVGAYGEIARDHIGREPVLVSPNTWKGQLSKVAVKARIARALDNEEYREHIADAVGMGLAVQGRL